MPGLGRMGRVAVVLSAGLVLGIAPSGVAVSGAPGWTNPTANVQWDYQIGPAYTPPTGVTMVARDREATPAGVDYNSCYVNAYQTQPAETKWWKKNHNNLLLKKKGGSYVVDGYWGEVLLDMSTPKKRRGIARIVNHWIDGCASKGFDAVEPDNLDSWTRSGHRLTKANAFAFAHLIINHTHDQGLAIAQKNAAGQTGLGKKQGFDFAVAEECGRYNECGAYRKAYGNLVYVIEYRTKDYRKSCDKWGDQLSIIQRDRQVRGPGSAQYVYKSC
jgi:Glycoside-hydrolase family GH114